MMVAFNSMQIRKQAGKKVVLADVDDAEGPAVHRKTRSSSKNSNSQKRKAEEEPAESEPRKLRKTGDAKKSGGEKPTTSPEKVAVVSVWVGGYYVAKPSLRRK
jgi:hypothetical protein